MKNLATIQRVLEFKKHPNADKLNIIKVLGWQCVTAATYNVGDLLVYIQIDTKVPRTEWSEFLFKGESDESEFARIKTIKLRNEVSQGLCLPLSVLGNHDGCFMEGEDVTELLGVEKYSKPVPTQLSGQVVGAFPTHLVSITDEERIQNFPSIIDEFRGKNVYATIKMDGTSSSFINDGGKLRVCGRNWEYVEDDKNIMWKIARKYNLAETLPEGYIIQGEICGPGIQDNKAGLDEVDLFVFNMAQIHGRMYCSYRKLLALSEVAKFKIVPIHYAGVFKWNSVDELLAEADTVKYQNGKQAEGLVIRPLDESYSTVLNGRSSFKVISPSYAVKHGE